jgi:hypothetical protein
MNLVTSTYEKLDLFDNPTEILTMLTSENVQEAPSELRGDLQTMFSMLDDNSSQQKLDWAQGLLRNIAYYDETPPVFRVNSGENFSIRIELEEGRDFSNYVLTIRRADTNALLSPSDTAGGSYQSAPVQNAYINNLNLPVGEFFKTHVLVENTDGSGEANGDAVTLLTNAWLLVTDSIDA